MKTPSSLRARTVLAAATVLALLALVAPARADDPIPPILPTGSPSPSPSPSGSAKPKPKPKPSPSSTPSSTPRPAPKGPAPDPYRGAIAEAVDYWRNLPKTPARTTTALLELLQRQLPPGHELDRSTLVKGVWRFPIAGYTWYQDDFAAPRYEPYFHMHEGTDLFAQEGTLVVASADGVITRLLAGSIGGNGIWLTEADGTYYYYGHLKSYAPGLTQGMRVKIGQVLGTVGRTGIAVETYPHVHFEVHPGGGKAVNPKPFLDRWLFEAEARAQEALRRQAALTAAARIGAARWGTLFDLLARPAAEPAGWWASALDGATLGFADLALDRIAYEVDWASVADGTGSHEHEEASPVTPALIDGGILAHGGRPGTFDDVYRSRAASASA
ncbi:MAG TPA: M23 family metallopeptidase [Actinomycetota bacterium]|nr:M23 family metallopeptidase [Actinomycetota bacterium]